MRELLSRVAALEAVFIWAPIARCGTTLLQRLITSSREVLVYGEDFLLARHLPMRLLEVAANEEDAELARGRLVGGDYAFWSPAAAPRTDLYSEAVLRSFVEVVLAYETSTREDGFPRWGVKHPEFTLEHLHVLRDVLPRSRHVCLYRRPEDALRSMKARRWFTCAAEAAGLARQWKGAVGRMLELAADEDVLVLRYEDLAREIDRLRRFLCVSALDRSVLEVKVNTFEGSEGEGHGRGEYIAPVELTEEERLSLEEIPAPLLEATGYGAKSASRNY